MKKMKKWEALVSVNCGEYYSVVTFLAKEASIGKEREILDKNGRSHSEYPLYFDGNEICFDEPIDYLFVKE